MGALESLQSEHQLLSNVTASLAAFASSLEEPSEPEKRRREQSELLRFVRVLEEICDSSHIAKQESLLLPEMVRCGLAWDQGPISEARRTHLRQRHWLATLSQAAAQRGAWSESRAREVAAAVKEYVQWLRRTLEHSQGELIPQALKSIPPQRLAMLDDEMRRFDEASDTMAHSGPSRDELLRMAEDLIQRYR